MNQPISAERVFVISGEDKHGDQHMFMTTSLDRAMARYQVMARDLSGVTGNDAFEEFGRPLLPN